MSRLPEELERYTTQFDGPSYWNINVVVNEFERKKSLSWTPQAPCYDYKAEVMFYFPYYNSLPGRKDTYPYNVLYSKTGKNIHDLFEDCNKDKARMESERERSDKESRILVNSRYKERLLDEQYDYLYNNEENKILSEINPTDEDALKLTKLLNLDSERETEDKKLKSIEFGFIISSEGIAFPNYDENVKMNEFKNLVAQFMSKACYDLFGPPQKDPLPLSVFRARDKDEEINDDNFETYWKQMYRAEVDITFWNELMNGIEIEDTENMKKGKMKNHPLVCDKTAWDDEDPQFIMKYIVQKKFRLVGNYTRRVPGLKQPVFFLKF
jgi:hypothetical protein